MAPVHSFPVAHKAWRTPPPQKAFIEKCIATLPSNKRGKGNGLDTTECGDNWRKNWGSPWRTPDEPALKDNPSTVDFYVRPTVFFAPLFLHERLLPKGLACPTCEDGGVVTGSGWNPSGPRKVRSTRIALPRAPVLPHIPSDD